VSYTVYLTRPGEKDLRRLPQADRERCYDAMRALGDDPRPAGCRKLVGEDGYRIRVGVYRIMYGIDDAAEEVTVYRVLHRKNAYR
jgi:mRNA interferase RelE/StbE